MLAGGTAYGVDGALEQENPIAVACLAGMETGAWIGEEAGLQIAGAAQKL